MCDFGAHEPGPGGLAGAQTTVQDLGRFGWAQYGVSASGAADPVALRAANLIVGNAENAPALEMTLAGGAFEFEGAATIAIGGSDFGADLPLWTPIDIAAGQAVKFGATRSGARSYVAFRGGLAVPLVMGSASVHVTTGVGGRPLRAGDVLELETPRSARTAGIRPTVPGRGAIRVTPGPQADRFAGELYEVRYTVSEESNRMGLRLRGPAIPSPSGGMLTEGTPWARCRSRPTASRLSCLWSIKRPAAIRNRRM